METGDVLLEQGPPRPVMERLAPLPGELLYSLSVDLSVRIAAAGTGPTGDQLDTLIDANWRAVTK